YKQHTAYEHDSCLEFRRVLFRSRSAPQCDDESFSEATRRRYERIRDTVGLTAMFSGGFDGPPIPGVRTGMVDASDPMRNEHGVRSGERRVGTERGSRGGGGAANA